MSDNKNIKISDNNGQNSIFISVGSSNDDISIHSYPINRANPLDKNSHSIVSITNNNAKYYQEQAERSASEAQKSASDCANYMTSITRLYNECENIKNELEDNISSSINSHIEDSENPHKVNAEQVNTYTKEELDIRYQPVGNYLTEHQDISQKVNYSDLSQVATSGNYDDLMNKPAIPQSAIIDNALSLTSTNSLQNSVITSVFNTKQDIITDIDLIRNGANLGSTAVQPSTLSNYYNKEQSDSLINTVKRNIGEVVTSTIPLTDAGLHLLDGSLISGSGVYSEFVEYIASIYDASASYFCTESDWQNSVTTYGVCGKFVYDSVNNTVRLPKITGFTEGTTDVNTLGDLTEAGLPNITGSFYRKTFTNDTTTTHMTGAFTMDGSFWDASVTPSGANKDANGIVNFNASLSNPIYGNSTTVQPQSVKVLYYIVVATSAKTDIQVDIDNIATDLNNALNQYKYDGQWVVSLLQANSATAIGTVTIDLSSYLPQDNYNYEVMVNIYLYSNPSSGNTMVFLNSDIIDNSDTWYTRVASANANSRTQYNRFIIPVGSGRWLKRTISEQAASVSCSVALLGYRRLGTNS